LAPQGVYRCAGDDQWLALTVRDTDDWHALRHVLGDPVELRDPAFDDVGARRAAHDAIDAAISAWTAMQDKSEAFHALQRAGVPAGPVMDEADATADPQLDARGFFRVLEHPSCGAHLHPGANFHLSRTPPVLWRAAPVLGQDNEYVYRELLGVSDDEYAELVAEAHIGDRYL
jgi:crotonobetainyl-CoA:carnitine CoA-transferase CaiB-like acyl-CoA transferase